MNDWNKNNKADLFDRYVDYQSVHDSENSSNKNNNSVRNAKIAYTIAGIMAFLALLPIFPIALLIALWIWCYSSAKKQYLIDHPSYYQTKTYHFFHRYRFVIRGVGLFIVIILVLSLMSNPIYIG